MDWEAASLLHLGYDAEDPLPLPMEIRGESDNRLLSVRRGHKESAAVKGVGVRIVISPPPHGSGFILPPRPQRNLISCISLVWAQPRRLFRALTLPKKDCY